MARRGTLKRRVRSLSERETEGRRDLGFLVLEMYRRDELDTEALGRRAEELSAVAEELEGLKQELGEPEAEEPATAEILALEEDLEREQERAGQALEDAQAQLQAAEQRAAQAERVLEERSSEARSSAAEWLRGQAEAMRREAERQVRE